eukprot:6722999-Pyramimonas_sp.AAC.1
MRVCVNWGLMRLLFGRTNACPAEVPTECLTSTRTPPTSARVPPTSTRAPLTSARVPPTSTRAPLTSARAPL